MHSRSWRQTFKDEWLLLVFGLLTLGLALGDPRPWSDYQRWLQVPTLAGLLGLLLAIQGIGDSALVQRAALALAARAHSLRGLGLLLVGASAVLSMLLTNDVSLFLLVPLSASIAGICNLPLSRMVILEALAVNAGSSLSPIGNPQNLLLWQHARLSFMDFVAAMLPASAVMLALVGILTWCWLPRGRIALERGAIARQPLARGLGIASLLALLGMVLAMEYGHALAGALVLLALFAAFARVSAKRIDWWLLLTFAAIFLGLGHFAELAPVRAALAGLELGRPASLYLSGVLASQLISNVPATVLLLDHVQDPIGLAVAVNVGGFGLALGSLANLIALRLARQPRGLWRFHAVSIPFLLLTAPLVYLAWRACAAA